MGLDSESAERSRQGENHAGNKNRRTSNQKETADPLPSWNDNNVKRSILDFVTRVSTEGGAEFVPPKRAHRRLRQRRYTLVRAALFVLPIGSSPSIGFIDSRSEETRDAGNR